MAEEISGIFKPDAKNIIKIFSDADSYYQIPDYQRPYSWEDDQVEQLWDDIYSAMESGDESYFLGPVILIKTKDRYEVVDGHQRLTTLTILFCVVRDFYKEKLENLDGIDRTLINKVQNAVKSMVDGKIRLKLITQLNHQAIFEHEILERVKLPDNNHKEKEKKKDKIDNRYLNTAKIFKKKLEEVEIKSGISIIGNFIEYVLNKVEMITIICSKQSYAIKLFQVLNTRGLDLTPADLIKSHLYGSIEEEFKKNEFVSIWNEIESKAKSIGETITELLTYYEYYLLAQNPKKSLYEELLEIFKSEESVKVLYEFKRFVEKISEIVELDSKLMFSFKYLPNQVFWKAILTTAKYEDIKYFDELCKELRRLYYCYWIAGYTTSKIKQLSFNIIAWLKQKKPLVDIRVEINRKMTDDNVIQRASENLKNDAYGQAWLRPLLVLIEYEQTDDSKVVFIELNNKLNVDHILPIGWKSRPAWKKNWKDDEAQKWINKIGNLTLLSGEKNKAQHNDPPSKKRKMYERGHGGKTAFEISKRVITLLDTSKWTKREVKRRQKWMLRQVEKILDFRICEPNANVS